MPIHHLNLTARTSARVAAVGAAAALSLVLAACSGGETGSMSGMDMPTSSSTSATSTGPSSTTTSSTGIDAEHNAQDVMFAQMMIVHHQGAIEMSKMAATQASSQQVKDLAAMIEAAQQPEIEEMTSWLNAWGAPITADSSTDTMGSMEDMDHSSTAGTSGMSGMSGVSGTMTEEQMTQLQNATGPSFDRMFLQLMIEHHTGAVQMAETEQQKGSNPQAQELADSIVTSQSAQIEQMKQMLTTLQ